MSNSFDFSTYVSPFTWRYGSADMREIFSEKHKYETWRRIWVTLAEIQYQAGLITREELQDLKDHERDIDIKRILEIETETRHDVMAAIKEFAEKAKKGGGKIHLGATSMDIVDNAETLRMKEALRVIQDRIRRLLRLFAEKITLYADLPCMGYTHLQPAEPTTVGYRFAFYAQDLMIDYEQLLFILSTLKSKGMKGAVGTAAGYASLLQGNKMYPAQMEERMMKKLGLDAVQVSSQVSPRKYDFFVLSSLASIASSVAKFAGDLRILQSPLFGEWSEPFGKKQVGSSAMPFKKNPINSEKICSLARYVLQLPAVSLENATLSYLERTLDDSANRRLIIPEAFLTVDEILITAEKIITDLVINETRIAHNFSQYAPFAASETILMATVKKGADRQKMHDVLKDLAMLAWAQVQQGRPNPMEELMRNSKDIMKYVTKQELERLFHVDKHVGDAPERAMELVKKIKFLMKK